MREAKKQDERELERLIYDMVKREHEGGHGGAIFSEYEMGPVLEEPSDDELIELMSEGSLCPEPKSERGLPRLRSGSLIQRPTARWAFMRGGS